MDTRNPQRNPPGLATEVYQTVIKTFGTDRSSLFSYGPKNMTRSPLSEIKTKRPEGTDWQLYSNI